MRIPEPFGPFYPKLGNSVAKYRKQPRRPEIVAQHGETVLEAIRRLQRQELARAEAPPPPIHCASGTRHNTPEKIMAAVRQRHLAQLHRRPFPDPISAKLTA